MSHSFYQDSCHQERRIARSGTGKKKFNGEFCTRFFLNLLQLGAIAALLSLNNHNPVKHVKFVVLKGALRE